MSRSAHRQILECASLLALSRRLTFKQRQGAAALQDALASAQARIRFMAPMRVQAWSLKLSINFKVTRPTIAHSFLGGRRRKK